MIQHPVVFGDESRQFHGCLRTTGGEADDWRSQARIATQSRRGLESFKAILIAGRIALDHIVQVTVFMTNSNNFNKNFTRMRDVYGPCFPTTPQARWCIEVNSPAREGLEIEVEWMAAIYGQVDRFPSLHPRGTALIIILHDPKGTA